MTIYLDLDDLLEVASVILDTTDAPVRDLGLVSSAAARPSTSVFGVEAYEGVWTKAAALLHSICVNHALIDGNKRLAWTAARVFLALNDVTLAVVDVDQAEKIVMAVADGSLREVSEIAVGLRRLYSTTA